MAVRRDTRNGRWLFRKMVRLPDGRRVRIYGTPTSVGLPPTRIGAEEAERRAVAQAIETGLARPKPREEVATVREFAAVHLEVCAVKNKPSTLKSKQGILRVHLLPFIGEMRLDQVTFGTVEDIKVRLAKRPTSAGARMPNTKRPRALSAKTINDVLLVLHGLLKAAKKRGLIAAIPEFEWLPQQHPEFDFLTFDEADRMLAAADGEWRTMLLVAMRTGLRKGEILGLRWQDVDLAGGRIMVRQNVVDGQYGTPKSGKAREIPLGDEVRAALKAHRHLRGPLVFCTDRGGLFTTGELKRPIERAYERAKLRPIGWHVLRHTFASHLVMRGASLKVVQELLGHSTILMTMRYAHLAPEVARDAVRLLDGCGSGVAAGTKKGHK
jgi:integrase